MKTKAIATIVALGMVLTAFSMFASAGAPNSCLSRVAPAADGTRADTGANAPNGIAYMWEQNELFDPVFGPACTVATWGTNTKGIPVNGPGTWTYNALYTQCTADAGSIWNAWVAGENTVMIYEVFNDQSVSGRNYTMIYEAVVGAASTNYGAQSAQNALTLINDPTVLSAVVPTAVIQIAPQTTGFEVAALFDGYGVYKSTTGPITQTNQGTYLGDATLNAGVWEYTDNAFAVDSYYAVKVKWDGGSLAPNPTFFAPLYSYGMSNDVLALAGGPPNVPPVVDSAVTTPNPHNGNIASEFVTLTASASDADAGPAATILQYSIDGGAWTTFTSPYVHNFPNGYATGLHNIDVRAYDGQDYSPIVEADFTITDTTAPVVAWNAQPGATAPYNAALNFVAGYGDFTPYNVNVANSYFQYRVDNGTWTNVAWNNQTFAWGSYLNTLAYSIPGGTFAIGDWVEYDGQVTDGSGLIGLLAAGTVQILDAPPAVQDPYPIYGYVWLYNGNAAGVYTPIISPAGTVVTAHWISSLTGLEITGTDTTNALGQFSIDCLNYTDTNPVWLTATFTNNGYNYTTFDIAGFPGGRQQDVVCGVPYDVIYNPIPPATVIAGAAYPVTYQIVDRDGAICTGYYTFADGPMNFFSGDALFVNDANHPLTFDGVGGAVTDGTYTGSVQFFTGGIQYLNITENGILGVNPYLTPWGNVQTMVAGALVDIWFDDWANTTVQVISGAFIWNLDVGWNQVCVPMDPVDDGLDGVFGAFDALREVNAVTLDANCAIAHRTGGNPSNYQVFDFGLLETDGLNFAMNYVEGYWIWSNVDSDVSVQAINVSAPGVDNVITLSVGWNLLGFTHNYMCGGAQAGGWNAVLNADDFVSGAVDADLDTAGSNVKIVATWWVQATQWYNSYVETDTFPGMAGSVHDWIYDTTYAYGYFVWSDEADVIEFNLVY